MPRFTVELSFTIYADDEDAAQQIAERVERQVRANNDEDVGSVSVGDVEEEGGE